MVCFVKASEYLSKKILTPYITLRKILLLKQNFLTIMSKCQSKHPPIAFIAGLSFTVLKLAATTVKNEAK